MYGWPHVQRQHKGSHQQAKDRNLIICHLGLDYPDMCAKNVCHLELRWNFVMLALENEYNSTNIPCPQLIKDSDFSGAVLSLADLLLYQVCKLI